MENTKIYIIPESTENGTDRNLIDSLILKYQPFKNYKHDYIFDNRSENKGSIGNITTRLLPSIFTKSIFSEPNISKILLIIVDADENPKQRFKDICNALDKNIFSIPKQVATYGNETNKIKVGIFLFPNSKEKGSLETLCYDAIKENPTKKKNFIETYLKNLKENKIDSTLTENNKSKAKFRIFMSTPQPDYNYVKNALNIIDLDNACFKPLIDFLKKAVIE